MRLLLQLLLALAVVGAFSTRIHAQDSPHAIADSAEEAYLDGLSLLDDDPAAARTRFQEAARGYQELLDNGAHSSGAWFNLGNALLRSGNVGEAIVAYRRAERIDPSNDDVAANLAEARSRVESRIEPDANNMSFTTVAGWWHSVSPTTRLWIGLVAWVLFWALLALRYARRRNEQAQEEREFARAGWLAGIWGTITIAVIAAGTLLFDTAFARMYPVGVLTNDQVVLRSGNGEGFGAIAEEPLHEGVEFTILELRPGWWRVELADGTVGWIPAQDAQAV